MSVDDRSMARVPGTNRNVPAPGNFATTSDDTMGGRYRQDTRFRFYTSYGASGTDNDRVVGHELARSIPVFTDNIDRSWPRSSESIGAADRFSAEVWNRVHGQ